MRLNPCCCCGTDQRAVERLAVTLVKPQRALTCTRMRKVRTVTSLAGTTSHPAVTCAHLGPQTPLLSRPRHAILKMLRGQRTTPRTPGLQTHAQPAHDHLCTEWCWMPALLAASSPNGATLCLLRHPGITSGLMKGALSVAASAYKALFTGQGPTQVSRRAVFVLCRSSQCSRRHVSLQPPVDASTQDTMMAVLVEMGFGDRPLNQRLLNKYNYNLLDVVNELVQMSDNDWYSTRY